MIERVLPAGAAGAYVHDFTLAGPLSPAERASLGRVGPGREREFAAGRHCARTALARLGITGIPVPRGADQAPVWPAGVVGSITHCARYAAAAVALGDGTAAIGIDAEPNAPLKELVRRRVAGPGELPEPDGAAHWDRLLFCAKESVYKAWSPLTGRPLGFLEARVTFEPESRAGESDGSGTSGRSGVFHAEILVPSPFPGGFSGRFLALPDLLLTAIVHPRGE